MVETSSRSALLSPRAPRRGSSSSLELLERPIGAPNRPRHAKRGRAGARAAAAQQGSGVISIPRIVMPIDRDNDKHAKHLTQSRSSRGEKGRLQRGDAAMIVTLIGCASAMCLLGTIYLAAYARVAKQEREIHSLQLNVSVAQARHQMLVQDLAHLQNDQRIDSLASRMRMVHVGASEYIAGGAPDSVLADNTASMAGPAQMASAR